MAIDADAELIARHTRTTTVTDPLQQTTQLTHDTAGRLLQVRGAALGGPTLAQTLTYDADGNLASATDARHQATRFAYDERGNLIRRTDPAGHVQEQRYDSANRLTAQTQYTTPDPDGARLMAEHAADHATPSDAELAADEGVSAFLDASRDAFVDWLSTMGSDPHAARPGVVGVRPSTPAPAAAAQAVAS